MSDTDVKWLAGLVAAGLVVVVALGAIVGSSSTARDLQPRAEAALVAAGLDGVLVDLDGREAVLSGGSRADRREARDVVEALHGVRWARVEDDVDGVDQEGRDGRDDTISANASTIELHRGDDGVEIDGVVPDVDAAADIKAAASLVLGATVAGDLRVDASVGSSPWVPALPGLLGDLVAVDDLDLAIDGGGTVVVGGTIQSEAGRSKALELVRTALPDLEIVDDLEVDPGGLDEADAASLNGVTLYFAAGQSVLSLDHVRSLDVVADVLRRNSDVTIEAGAHYGPGDPVAGRELSDERAAAVEAYLVSRGIEASRIGTRSFGTDRAEAPGADAERYRRVDFVIEES